MNDMRKLVNENPVLAILRGVPDDKLISRAGAIYAGGVRFFEVALNTPGAAGQITALRKAFGDAYIGAGTAITVERAEAALRAGAQFLLSPSTDPDVLGYCAKEGVPMLPGALTPTDVSTCLRYGFDVIKLFPAGDMPLNYVKSLKGPFDGTDYVAIGGVNAENAAGFIRAGCIGVGLGSNILPKGADVEKDREAAAGYVAGILKDVKKAKAEVGK